MRTAWSRALLVAVLLAVGPGGGLSQAEAQHARRTPVVEAVARARPSVVTVKALRRSGSHGQRETVGTGVIVDERGYVITCQHVVAGAGQLSVRLTDGTDLVPRVVASDAHHDLAILHIQTGKKLPALPLGPSSDLLVGETVIAVGHPYGYSHTVSTGIVSCADREITMPEGPVLGDLIQTTASINPGNSGGPLLNINGEWIGLALAMREGAQGIAFALKSDTVRNLLSNHLSAFKLAGLRHGLVCREAVSEENACRQLVRVNGVAERSPAARAGLRPGDTILRVADRVVANRFDVERALWGRTAGERVEMAVVRGDRELHVTLTLAGARESGPAQSGGRAADEP